MCYPSILRGTLCWIIVQQIQQIDVQQYWNSLFQDLPSPAKFLLFLHRPVVRTVCLLDPRQATSKVWQIFRDQ